MNDRIGGLGQVPDLPQDQPGNQTATVMVGESKLSDVAGRLGIDAGALAAANPNLDPESVGPGQELNLPQDLAVDRFPVTTDSAPAEPAARSNVKTMLGDLNLGGQIRELQLKDSVMYADSKADTSALRLKMLPQDLDAAKIPAKMRDELVAQASKKSGAELTAMLDEAGAALKSKNPADAIKSLVMKGRVDASFDNFTATYDVNGKQVKATPHFRMSNGFSGAPGRTDGGHVQDDLTNLIQKNDKKDWNDAMKRAVHQVAFGRPSADQIKMVTDALIKSGQFEVAQKAHPGLSDSETIRMMQWDHGVGIDCAGYVQQAFLEVQGGKRSDYGLNPSSGEENLSSLKGNPNFTQVKPENVKPGDLIILDPPKKNEVGHTVLVRDHHVASNDELKALHDTGHFAKPGDVIHLYDVDASFGAGDSGNLHGGLQRKTWVYNETTSKWGQLEAYPSTPPSLEMVESDRTGPYNHPMNGIFHPKGK